MQPCGLNFLAPIPISLDVMAYEVGMQSELTALCCPHCDDPLDLQQPDQNDGTKLVGTCESCGSAFFAVETNAEWGRAIMIELPSAEYIFARFGAKLASA